MDLIFGQQGQQIQQEVLQGCLDCIVSLWSFDCSGFACIWFHRHISPCSSKVSQKALVWNQPPLCLTDYAPTDQIPSWGSTWQSPLQSFTLATEGVLADQSHFHEVPWELRNFVLRLHWAQSPDSFDLQSCPFLQLFSCLWSNFAPWCP